MWPPRAAVGLSVDEAGPRAQGVTTPTPAARGQEHAHPVLEAFADWLAEQTPRVLPKSAIGEAVTYAMN